MRRKQLAQGGETDRLHKVVVEAGLLRADMVLGLIVARDGSQKKVRAAVLGAKAPGHFIAIHTRQADIEQHHFRSKRVGRFQRGNTVIGGQDFVTIMPHQHGQGLGSVRVIIDDEDAAAERVAMGGAAGFGRDCPGPNRR
jgi:hypothetical protein